MAEKDEKPENVKEQKTEIEIEYITPKKSAHKPKSGAASGKSTPSGASPPAGRDPEFDQLKKEYDELKEDLLRQLAEKENLRKRLEREKTDFYQYALSECLTELLSVLDNFERALESPLESNGKNFVEGVRMIYRQLMDVAEKQGVKPIRIEGDAFDPQFHQALITEESEEVEQPKIAQELQRGYTLHDRLLRPTLVKVLVPKKRA